MVHVSYQGGHVYSFYSHFLSSTDDIIHEAFVVYCLAHINQSYKPILISRKHD